MLVICCKMNFINCIERMLLIMVSLALLKEDKLVAGLLSPASSPIASMHRDDSVRSNVDISGAVPSVPFELASRNVEPNTPISDRNLMVTSGQSVNHSYIVMPNDHHFKHNHNSRNTDIVNNENDNDNIEDDGDYIDNDEEEDGDDHSIHLQTTHSSIRLYNEFNPNIPDEVNVNFGKNFITYLANKLNLFLKLLRRREEWFMIK